MRKEKRTSEGVKHDDPADFNGRCHHVQWEVRLVSGVSRAPRGGLTYAHWLLWGSVEKTPLDIEWALGNRFTCQFVFLSLVGYTAASSSKHLKDIDHRNACREEIDKHAGPMIIGGLLRCHRLRVGEPYN